MRNNVLYVLIALVVSGWIALYVSPSEKVERWYANLDEFRNASAFASTRVVHVHPLYFSCYVDLLRPIPRWNWVCDPFVFHPTEHRPWTDDQMDRYTDGVDRFLWWCIKPFMSLILGWFAVGGQILMALVAPFVPLSPQSLLLSAK